MKPNEFVSEAKIGDKILIGGATYIIMERIKWKMLRSGQCYNKYALLDENDDDTYRFAEDPDYGGYLLVKRFTLNSAGDPFLQKYMLDGEEFSFVAGEICVAVEVEGKSHQKKGDYDIWWDYESKDGRYMSLGCDLSGKRADLIGRKIKPDDVKLR